MKDNLELCKKYKENIKKLSIIHNPKYSYISLYYAYMYRLLNCKN